MQRASLLFLIVASAFSFTLHAEVPEGIPRTLAQERAARVSDIHYALHFSLVSHAATTEASETLEFTLSDAGQPLLLDYRDGRLKSLTINGHAIAPTLSNGHIVLPVGDLHVGKNVVAASFASHVATAEKAITRFDDPVDGAEYLYTLFVPMDASMAFPCFDQPDLKGRFQLTLDAPVAWTLLSNTAMARREASSSQQQVAFEETKPISTYLFAFAAGPFVKVHDEEGLPGLYVRRSKAATAEKEAPEVQRMAADGMRYLSGYFRQPFPFPKYDMVLIPGFAFGGMEHAGATFLREESVLFRTAPTQTDLLNRDIVVLHELTHQWFGDFTTMRWFDDLWLKEGFAEYMAFQALDTLKPQDHVWKRFYELIKPGAYDIDQTQGTTPIYQDISNLTDAKSAYGAIVYSKAPAVLKQLAYVLGPKHFREGLVRYLAGHPYGNAAWNDLIHAFEAASGQPLDQWAEAWIRRRGMPMVQADWSCREGRLDHLVLTQHDVLGTNTLWPIASKVLLGHADGTQTLLDARWNKQSAAVPGAAGQACPAYVFANAQDEGYGLFLLDKQSLAYVAAHLDAARGGIAEPFLRSMLWGSLWQSVRMAQYDPARYAELVLHNLPDERDTPLVERLLAHEQTALHHYVGVARRREVGASLSRMAIGRMSSDPDQDLRITWFHALPGLAEVEPGRSAMKSLLRGKLSIQGVQLRVQDRWRLVTALIAYNDPESEALLTSEQQRSGADDGPKYAYVARAAKPDKANKQFYFHDYLNNPKRSEDWITLSLDTFNYWNQPDLTEPFVKSALDALPQIKQQRKIFFLMDWVDAFLGNQESPEIDRQVHAYLQSKGMDANLKLKVLQALDELDRTVNIRRTYGVK
ncbi:M1 family aminopeptidase [Frateuria sp. Soil773]|uniref:M1 family metallopeptidase n=1 Tax=Frateuria sp. Soil773 TaxID=1736407 RepID=UPI000B133D0A|nr:M1 family aminopeptidase [Frateuria sp. Soil773]